MSPSLPPGEHSPQRSLIERVAAQPDLAGTLDNILAVAVEMVPSCSWAGITHRENDTVGTLASTDPIARQADDLQYELGEGPCLEAVWADDTFRVDDTLDDPRFPRWGPRAAEIGIRSSLSVRLTRSSGGRTITGLNFYGSQPHGFDDDDVHVAYAFAARAAAALSVSRQITGLQTALQTRHTIGVAQGMICARHRLSVDDAFKVLVRLSRDNNVKLAALAEEVVASGGIPPRFGRPVDDRG